MRFLLYLVMFTRGFAVGQRRRRYQRNYGSREVNVDLWPLPALDLHWDVLHDLNEVRRLLVTFISRHI